MTDDPQHKITNTHLPWNVTDWGRPELLDGARLQCMIWSGADVVAYCHPRDVRLLVNAPTMRAALEAIIACSETDEPLSIQRNAMLAAAREALARG